MSVSSYLSSHLNLTQANVSGCDTPRIYFSYSFYCFTWSKGKPLFLLLSLYLYAAKILQDYSEIDAAKHQLEVSKKGVKSKQILLTNTLKIITFTDITWGLWKEVISCATRRDLINVDLKDLKPFNKHNDFVPEKDDVLSREFFKFLANLSVVGHIKLCCHIFNQLDLS